MIDRIRPLPSGPPKVEPVKRVRRHPRDERDPAEREGPPPRHRQERDEKPENGDGHVDVRA